MRITPFFVLLAGLIFISGCAMFAPTETKVVGKDVLAINYVEIFPEATLIYNQVFNVRLEVENVGEEKATFAVGDNGTDVMFDYCADMFTLQNFDSFPYGKKASMTLIPGDSNTFVWTLKAPSKEKTLGLTVKCTLKFAINYDSKARTTTYIYFINPIEKEQREYTQAELALIGDNVATRGPVVINFETPEQPVPAYSGSTYTIYFNMQNVGTGTAKVKNLNITLDPTMQETTECGQYFDRVGNTIVLKKKMIEDERLITIFKDTSSKIGCSINSPQVPIIQPYLFVANAEYNYSLMSELKIQATERQLEGVTIESS